MATLKGGTVVDGNFYVEGGLHVRNITDDSGNKLPHFAGEDTIKQNRLVKFADNEGGITYSPFGDSSTVDATILSSYTSDNQQKDFAFKGESMSFPYKSFELQTKDSTIKDDKGNIIETNLIDSYKVDPLEEGFSKDVFPSSFVLV